MIRRSIPSLLLSAAFLSFSSTAGAQEAPAGIVAAAAAESSPAPGDSGMVWKVTGGKAVFHLAGSLHLLKPSSYPLPAAYDRAYAESSRVVMEVMPGEMEKPETIQRIVRQSMLPGADLQKQISPETWQAVETWSAGTGTSTDMLKRMKPWMVSLTVAMTAYSKEGYRANLGLEKHFGGRLKQDGKTGEGLETAAYQIGLFDTLGAPLQEKMILQAVKEAGEMRVNADKLYEAWRAGDAAGLGALMSKSMEEYPDLSKVLLTDRNAAWMKRITELLEGGENTMLLVGAGHIVGTGGLLELLENRGYHCEKLLVFPPLEEKPAPPALKKAA